MAVVALVNEYLAINGATTNINDHVKSATLSVEADQLDSTAMGDSWKESIGGLKSGTLSVEFNEDVAASNIDAILWPLLGTVATFEVRIDAGSVSTSNPKYTGSVLVTQHTIGGSIGELGAKSVTWPTTGTVTRATS